MNATNHKWIAIATLFLVTILIFTGCQTAQKVQPTATPAETVVAEREANCPIVDFATLQEPIKVNDPVLGETSRAFVIKAAATCAEPYLKGKSFVIQDGIPQKDGTEIFTVFNETVTDEGGVWKTLCEGMSYDPGKTNRCTWKGEGLYQGLQMVTEYNNDTSNVKIRVTKLAEE
jgi:hypothetical protein